MSLGELQGPLKVPLEVLQAVMADKKQCVPVERVAEYVTYQARPAESVPSSRAVNNHFPERQ